MKENNRILYQLSEWFMRLSITNLVWFIVNLPLVYIIFNMVYAETKESLLILSIILILLIPFIFFPATTSLFAMARDWVLRREQDSLIKTFLAYYKANYRQSVLGGVLLTVVWVILFIDFLYLKNMNVAFMFSIIALAVVIYVFTIQFFTMLVHYDAPLMKHIKNALLMTIGSPRLLLIILITNVVILYISLGGWLVLLPFFTGSLIAFISFSAFYRFYLNIVDR